jgi:hypothetical protein|tara:strand:+ start:835 stop:1908 length:1074 start_codon:yes stop_codon:yes gene_type:complete
VSFSPDVLVTALQKLLPGYQETFTTYHPAFDAIVKNGQKMKLQQPYLEFGLVPSHPGSVTILNTGSEVIQGGRNQDATRANTMATTMIYAWDVPGEDLRRANGPADLLGLIKKYPERGLLGFQDLLGKQLVMGSVSEVGSFITFNGDVTYDPKGMGARQGIFSFQAASAQTDTVFGVAKNSVKGWHNKYAHINSFGSEGRKKLRNAFFECQKEGGSPLGSPDLIFASPDTFENYIDDLDTQILIGHNDMAKGDHARGDMRLGMPFLSATMYREHEIVPANFATTAAQSGVAYGINSKTWHLYTQGSDANMETSGDFALRGPNRIPNQDAWRYEYVFCMGMYTDNLRCNFAVTGGDTA